MFHSIMVALDMSAFGEQALPLARSIVCHVPAGQSATVHLVHVHVPIYLTVMGDAYGGGVPILDERSDAESRKQEQAYAESLRTTLGSMADVEVRCSILDGPIAATLAKHAEAIGAELIVMTTHGRGGMARMWLGNVVDALLRQCCVPVLVVRPTDPVPDHEPSIRRILIPLDGSPLAEQVLEPACTLGDSFDASYVLLHVFSAFPAGGYAMGVDVSTLATLEQHARAETQAYLAGIAERLRADGRVVDIAVCSEEQPTIAIGEAAREHGADMIALATHGRGGVRRWLLGSVADKVVRAAHTPVLLYHPR